MVINKSQIWRIGILLVLIVVFVKAAFEFYNSNSKDNLKVTEKPILEYQSLFKENLNTNVTYHSDLRSPISILDYKSKYSIIAYKIMTTTDFNMRRIHSGYSQNSKNAGFVYFLINETFFDLAVLSDSINKAREIFFTADENPEILYKNDSIVSYFINFKNFSIKYKKEGLVDLFGEVRPINIISEPIEANVIFLKKNGAIYFLVMSTNDRKQKIDKNLLISLLK